MDQQSLQEMQERLDALARTVPDEEIEFWFARDLQEPLGTSEQVTAPRASAELGGLRRCKSSRYLRVSLWFAPSIPSQSAAHAYRSTYSEVPLGYARWENFLVTIQRAITSCETTGFSSLDHFRDVTKMVSLGSGAEPVGWGERSETHRNSGLRNDGFRLRSLRKPISICHRVRLATTLSAGGTPALLESPLFERGWRRSRRGFGGLSLISGASRRRIEFKTQTPAPSGHPLSKRGLKTPPRSEVLWHDLRLRADNCAGHPARAFHPNIR
ncbi:MAG: hypothetical protein FWD77_07550 [Betaproteobacteria bacterium]|nr:hypothetical protein [Betaproteobacteria bacterium]